MCLLQTWGSQQAELSHQASAKIPIAEQVKRRWLQEWDGQQWSVRCEHNFNSSTSPPEAALEVVDPVVNWVVDPVVKPVVDRVNMEASCACFDWRWRA